MVVEVWVLDTSSDSSDYPIRREKQQQQPVGSHPEVSAFTRVSKQVNPIDGAGSGGSGVGGFWSNSISTSSSSSDGGSTGARLLGLVKLPVGCLYDAAAATTLNDVSNESGDVKLEFKAAAGVLPYMVPLTEV